MNRDHYGRISGEHWNGFRLPSERRSRADAIKADVQRLLDRAHDGPATASGIELLPGERESDYEWPCWYTPTAAERRKRSEEVAELKAKGVIRG